MSSESVRAILEQLARGEITAEEADEQISSSQRTDATTDEGPWLSDQPVHVSADLNGGGCIEVQGADLESPRVDGPNRCTTTRVDAGFVVSGQIGDDAALLVPRDADLVLRLSGATARIGGIHGTFDARIDVGDVDISCELTRGTSRVFANAGDLHLDLGQRSDVRLSVQAPCVVNAGSPLRKSGRGEWSLGDGRALLEIDGNLGTIYLEAG